MLERTPEPELMNDVEQAFAYSTADFSQSHDFFCEVSEKVFPLMFSGHVIDLGCGPADVLVRFARRFSRCSVTGVDGAQEMLKLGQVRIDEAGLLHRVVLKKSMISSPTLVGPFDGVISNSLLHHLRAPMDLWQTIHRVCRLGGPVCVMDLYRPHSLSELDDKVRCYADDAPDVLKRDFRASLHAAYTVEEISEQLNRAQLTNLQVEIVSDLHVAIWGTMTPA